MSKTVVKSKCDNSLTPKSPQVSQDIKQAAHASVQEHENTARILLNASDESIFLIDAAGIIIDLNDIMAQFLGRTSEELIGQSIYDLLSRDIADKMRERIETVLQTTLPWSFEEEYNFHFFGDVIFPVRLYSTIYPLRDQENRIHRLAIFGHDIAKGGTPRISTTSSEKVSSALVQNIPVGLFRMTPDPEMRIVAANPTLVRMYGFDNLEDLKNARGCGCFLQFDEIVEHFNKENQITRKEAQLVRRDGTIFWGAISAFSICDDSGKIIYIDGIIEDISLQKQAEEALQISEERFRNISGETQEWIWEIGRDLVFKNSNQRVEEILGYNPEEIIGKSMLDFLSEEELNRNDLGRDYLLRDVVFSGQEIRMLRKDGRTVITESSGVPIFRRNRTFVGFQGLTRDITERIQIRQEEESHRQLLMQADKMISLGVLVSGVAHEINNPNQFILANAWMLEKAWGSILPLVDRYYRENGDFQVAGAPYSEFKEQISGLFAGLREGSQRIKHIIMELKDYARNGSSDAKCPIDINAVLKSAMSILNDLLKKSTNFLRISCSESLPEVYGNFQRIEQVLINLIQNACQALPDKSRGISISTSYNPKNKTVLIRIKDEGNGIPADQMKYLFDLFYTTRRDSGGTGLGLPISKDIVNEHDGKLEVKSEYGKGTCVTVTLPAMKDEVQSS